MRLDPEAVRKAVAAHLSADVAERLALPDELHDSDVARRIVAALGVDDDLALKPLGVSLIVPGVDSRFVPADEIGKHPLCEPWMAGPLADVMARQVIAGARLYSAAADGGLGSDARLCLSGPERRLAATFELPIASSQGVVQAIVHYGEAEPAAFAWTLKISGQALFRIGLDARRLTAQREAGAPRPPPVAASAKLH